MAQSATPATQHPTSRHNGGTASQLRKRVRVTDEEDFRVTDEGLSLKNTFAKHVMQLFSVSIYLCHNLPSVSKSNPN